MVDDRHGRKHALVKIMKHNENENSCESARVF